MTKTITKQSVALQPSDTPWQRLDRAFRTALTVPKSALVKEEVRLKRQRQKKRAKKPT